MIVCLYQPDIPQNTGSLIRLCACMGVALHIIEPCGFIFDDKKMRRAMMDYYDLASVTRHQSWEKFLDYCQTRGRLILLTTKAEDNYTEFTFRPDDILLLGSESKGAPQTVHGKADARIKIPLHAEARSLNIAQAASMILGEALRQTNQFPA